MPKGTDPGAYFRKSEWLGQRHDPQSRSTRSPISMRGAYGTNFFTISMFKSGHKRSGQSVYGARHHSGPAFSLAGPPRTAPERPKIYGLIRSTFGWNELFQHQGLLDRPAA